MVFVLTHWINLISMVSLAFSGFYIHYPFFAGFMGVARGMHFFFMYVLIINLTFRILASFFVKSAVMLGTREQDTDIKNWLPQTANRHQLVPWIKYYLFFKKDHPLGGKYGVLQKIAYIATIPLTYFMAYTGFCHLRADDGLVHLLDSLDRRADEHEDPPLLHDVDLPRLHGYPRLPGQRRRLRALQADLRLGGRRGYPLRPQDRQGRKRRSLEDHRRKHHNVRSPGATSRGFVAFQLAILLLSRHHEAGRHPCS